MRTKRKATRPISFQVMPSTSAVLPQVEPSSTPTYGLDLVSIVVRLIIGKEPDANPIILLWFQRTRSRART